MIFIIRCNMKTKFLGDVDSDNRLREMSFLQARASILFTAGEGLQSTNRLSFEDREESMKKGVKAAKGW
jgi:hypothetical protein